MFDICFNHFIQRVKERYDLTLTITDLYDIAYSIKSGKAKLIKAEFRGFHYKVRNNGKLLLVVLNRSHSAFITALPMKESKARVTFSGKKFSYIDALYYNFMFYHSFNKKVNKKVICDKCYSNSIVVDLGKDRFKCLNCDSIIKFKDISKINPIYYNEDDSIIKLDSILWWKLYNNDEIFTFKDIKIKPSLQNFDEFGYSILYKDREIKLNFGCYSYNQLEENFYE